MINATDESFASDISGEVVVVKFGAEWCGPCKQIAPIFEQLEVDYTGRVKFVMVDIDATTVAQKFNIRGVPTTLIMKNGEVVNTIVGAQPKGRLSLAIDTALE